MKKHLIILTIALLSLSVHAFGQEGTTTTETQEQAVAAATKAPGTIRIAIAPVRIALGADDGTGAEVAERVRASLDEYMKGPTVEVISLESKTATNMAIECRQKECDAIVTAALSKKTKTSLFGSLVQAALPVVANQAAPAAGSDKQAMVDSGKSLVGGLVDSKFGAKDEVILDLTIARSGVATVKQSFSAKPKADGENVVLQLIEQGSEKVLQTILK